MESLTFGVGILSAGVVIAGLLLTVASESFRFWPPGDDDRKFKTYQVCSLTFFLSLFATGYLDWNAGPLPWPTSAVVGAALFAAGLVVARRGGLDLGKEETAGQVGDLKTDGVYRYTRNPQTVGYWLVFISLGMITNSVLVAVLAVLPAVWLYLMARVEEPWLRDQYGEAYAAYREDVPRFVGFRTFSRLFGWS
jgi:protein-S-isoprenylcysteine O-methyltransferase Ste14